MAAVEGMTGIAAVPDDAVPDDAVPDGVVADAAVVDGMVVDGVVMDGVVADAAVVEDAVVDGPVAGVMTVEGPVARTAVAHAAVAHAAVARLPVVVDGAVPVGMCGVAQFEAPGTPEDEQPPVVRSVAPSRAVAVARPAACVRPRDGTMKACSRRVEDRRMRPAAQDPLEGPRQRQAECGVEARIAGGGDDRPGWPAGRRGPPGPQSGHLGRRQGAERQQERDQRQGLARPQFRSPPPAATHGGQARASEPTSQIQSLRLRVEWA
ncbi:MAG TPA: hypothetical protein VGN08_11550 [Solirubrobacteraceae bacterium]|jgi:hypothetical protein